MARLLAIAKLNSDLTPHSLRHTQQFMDILGHSDDQITKNVYLHATKEMKKEASQKFAQLMRSLDYNPLC
ncbi:hypothetical protein SAMN05421578_103112 [Paenibacillus macquariensis]|uniref:Integrase n=1 Tax=Paenibacillus macquariensis TaxID=948756 RepID=A0ABY1JR28_9BACL|nr:hypothetical protein SAMN05421578_103112 [Paenibacillus macquariensis]